MKLEKIPVRNGKYSMWALGGKVINGIEFHYFCQSEKTKPSQLTETQIKRFLVFKESGKSFVEYLKSL